MTMLLCFCSIHDCSHFIMPELSSCYRNSGPQCLNYILVSASQEGFADKEHKDIGRGNDEGIRQPLER